MDMGLARDSSVSLHEQLKEQLYARIDSGEWRHGQRIPSERELCESYKVSRITVRQAIAAAVNEGRLYSHQGKGTFVNRPHIEQGLSRITTFSSTMQSLGMQPATQLLGWEVKPVDMTLTKVLNVQFPEQVINLRLLGMGNGEPMVYYDSWFPYGVGLEIVRMAERGAAEGKSFSTYDLYNRATMDYPKSAEQTFEAAAATPLLAKRLNVQERSPMFVITSVFYSPRREPIEFRKAYYRGETYRFHLEREFQ